MKKAPFIALSGLMALSLAGAGVASAFVINDAATASINSVEVEDVLILRWGQDQSVANITNLAAGTYQYRSVSVAAPVKSEGNAATAALTITIAAKDGCTMHGLTVELGDEDLNVQSPTIDYTLVAGTLDTKAIAISAAATWYLRISIDADEYAKYVAGTADGYTAFGATITAAYGQAA